MRLLLDRETDIITTGGRHPCLAHYRAGFSADGKFVAAEYRVMVDGGHRIPYSTTVLTRALLHSDGVYYCPNFRASGRACRTNTYSNTAFRGFGVPQGIAVAETVMDHAAHALGMEPHVVRRMNLYKEGQTTHYGQVIEGYALDKMWDKLLAEAEFERRKAEIARWNAEHSFIKRAIAVSPVKHGLSFELAWLNQGQALVNLYLDGSVIVSHSGTEMGQGINTKIAQIAAQELGVPLSRVSVAEHSTSTLGNPMPCAASTGTDLNGAATLLACQELNRLLQPVRADLPTGAPLEKVAKEAQMRRIPLFATGYYKTPGITFSWDTGVGRRVFPSISQAPNSSQPPLGAGLFRIFRVGWLSARSNSKCSLEGRG